METLSRREREKLNRREEILQAAQRVFASKGYDSATVDDIASSAELSKGTIYLYFQNKADLFLSTVETVLNCVTSITMEVISSYENDHVEGIKEIIKRHLNFFDENRDIFRILIFEGAHFELHSELSNRSDFKERIIQTMIRTVNAISDYIQNGINLGVFKQIDPQDAANVLLSIIRGFAFHFMEMRADIKLSEKTETIFTIFLDGLKN